MALRNAELCLQPEGAVHQRWSRLEAEHEEVFNSSLVHRDIQLDVMPGNALDAGHAAGCSERRFSSFACTGASVTSPVVPSTMAWKVVCSGTG